MGYILTQYFLPYLLHFHVILGHLKQKPGSLRSLSVSRTFLDFDLNHNFFVVVVYIRGRSATVAPSRARGNNFHEIHSTSPLFIASPSELYYQLKKIKIWEEIS